jgi:hypothetical protein
MATEPTITLEDRQEAIDYPEFHEVPGTGNRLGERTLQSSPHADPRWRSDADEMRKHFGIPEFDVEAFTEKNKNCIVFPDIIRHRFDPEYTPTEKATDCLIRGKKNSGKTTLRNNLVVQLLDNNEERVIDRGRTADSGWLPLRWWTTLWLPANASAHAEWVYEGAGDKSRELVDDLEDVVREVRTYDDVIDLVDQLGDTPVSSYHVVYPDPSFAGCEAVMRQSNRTPEHLPYTPAWDAAGGKSPTPLYQWWYAFIVAQLEHGHFDAFMSLLLDEGHELFPPNPSGDDHKTDKKLNLMQNTLNSARKRMLSWYLFTQYESKVDYRVKDEVTTRIYLADGRPNPVKDKSKTHPYGWGIVPMDASWMENRKYRGLCFVEAETGFAEFGWTDMTEHTHPEDGHRWLQIRLGEPDSQVRTSDAVASKDAATLEYDEAFFEYHDQTGHLFVRDPGSGQIDVDECVIDESLTAPDPEAFDGIDELAFRDELRRSDGGEHWEVVAEVGSRTATGGVGTQETVIARLPIDGATEVSE